MGISSITFKKKPHINEGGMGQLRGATSLDCHWNIWKVE
jgi:hypothetical protein